MDINKEEEMEKPLQVFCCYARKNRKDRDLLTQLRDNLKGLEREKLIIVRADVDINAGMEWENEIRCYLNTAHVILLLISPDFIASEYCYSIEMQQAIERHVRGEASVIPIILRPTDWHNAPFSKLQVLPSGGKPLSDWKSRDEAFLAIVRGIRGAVENLKPKTVPIASELLAQLNHYKEECQQRNTPFYTPHLLLALLKIHDSTTLYHLDHLNPSHATQFQRILERYVDVILPTLGRSFADFQWEERPDVQKAQQLALKYGSNNVTEGHLLLGVLDATSTSDTVDVLRKLTFRLNRVKITVNRPGKRIEVYI